MVRGQKVSRETSKELLSQTEIQTLTDEKKEYESTIKEIESGSGSGTASSAIDVNRLKSKVNYIDQAIHERTPEEARGKAKDSLIREERQLEDSMSEGMPTKYEMDHPARCPGAVRKHLAWDDRNKLRIRRYVEIQKILRPGEPKSIEALRKDK